MSSRGLDKGVYGLVLACVFIAIAITVPVATRNSVVKRVHEHSQTTLAIFKSQPRLAVVSDASIYIFLVKDEKLEPLDATVSPRSLYTLGLPPVDCEIEVLIISIGPEPNSTARLSLYPCKPGQEVISAKERRLDVRLSERGEGCAIVRINPNKGEIINIETE